MTEQTPTDQEIDSLVKAEMQAYFDGEYMDHGTVKERLNDFARAVLAKFGNQPAGAPWRSAVLDLIDECPGLTMEQDQWLSRRVKELDFASTPQPTHAQAGAVPLTDPQLVACIEAAGFKTWDNRMWALKRAIESAHGIKGGQHDTE